MSSFARAVLTTTLSPPSTTTSSDRGYFRDLDWLTEHHTDEPGVEH